MLAIFPPSVITDALAFIGAAAVLSLIYLSYRLFKESRSNKMDKSQETYLFDECNLYQ